MGRDMRFLVIVSGILVILVVLFLSFDHLRRQREEELARSTGDDELSRLLRQEAEEYGTVNRNQQLGILAAGLTLVLVAGGWWLTQRKSEPEQPLAGPKTEAASCDSTEQSPQ